MCEQLKVGDRVTRKTGRNRTVGVIERIYRAYGNPNGKLRAHVRWLGANRSRIGANSPDKYGGIALGALKLAAPTTANTRNTAFVSEDESPGAVARFLDLRERIWGNYE